MDTVFGFVCLAPLFGLLIFTCDSIGLKKVGDLKVVIDTDSGADDAMAILLMLSRQSKAKVLAITCVRGNTGVENATRNVFLMLQVANRANIPVYMGSPQGLAYEEQSTNFFGYDGIGDIFAKPPLDLRRDGHAAVALASLIRANPGEISVLCIGPLTNIALAVHLYPKFLSDVKELLVLGGSYKGGGNVSPGVEFNMHMDPEAAEFLFSKIPEGKLVTLLPVETVEENSYPMTWRLRDLGKIDSGFVRFLNKAERLGITKSGDTWQPFDPLAAGILLEPSIAGASRTARVSVETEGRRARGAMFVDGNSSSSNVRIVTGVAKVQFQSMLLSYLSG